MPSQKLRPVQKSAPGLLAEETGLSLSFSETPMTGFLLSRPNYDLCEEFNI